MVKKSKEVIAVEKYAEKTYTMLRKKHAHATNWYISLNIISLLLVASLVITNLWAIRWNVIDFNPSIRPLFFAGVILNAVSAMLTSIVSFFELKPKSKILKQALMDVDIEYKKWQNKEDKYKSRDRNSRIVTVVNIISKRVA